MGLEVKAAGLLTSFQTSLSSSTWTSFSWRRVWKRWERSEIISSGIKTVCLIQNVIVSDFLKPVKRLQDLIRCMISCFLPFLVFQVRPGWHTRGNETKGETRPLAMSKELIACYLRAKVGLKSGCTVMGVQCVQDGAGHFLEVPGLYLCLLSAEIWELCHIAESQVIKQSYRLKKRG